MWNLSAKPITKCWLALFAVSVTAIRESGGGALLTYRSMCDCEQVLTNVGLTKSSVLLPLKANTPDSGKPLSADVTANLATKAPINNPMYKSSVLGANEAMIGLAISDNTSDQSNLKLNRPLDLHARLNNPTFTSTVVGVSKAMVSLGATDGIPLTLPNMRQQHQNQP